MKKSDFINMVLDSPNNTVFTTNDQVENELEVFESLGMLPPTYTKEYIFGRSEDFYVASCTEVNGWEEGDQP
jgi:hypothetical protein